MTRPIPRLLTLAAVAAAVGLTACASSEPATDGSTSNESATAAQGPTEFEAPADAQEAIQQATQHVDETLAAISASSSGDDVDFRAYLGGSMLEGFAVPDGSSSPAPEPTSTVTIEGAPTVTEAGASTVSDGAVPFGAVQLDACLDLSSVVTTVDGEEQEPMSNPQTSFIYTVEYDADMGHWLLLSEDRGSSGCGA